MEEARLKRIDRAQNYWGQVDVESLIEADHPARAIWELIEQLPVEEFLKGNKSVAGRAGAERTDPRLLLSLWVYGLTLRIGSARELARRMEQEPGLRWLAGDASVNHHTLSDFRVDHESALEGLFSRVLAVLSEGGWVNLERLTLDGTKIQTQASAGSFRREKTLREHQQEAAELVRQLQQESQDEELRTRRAAARLRAARERRQRMEQALQELEPIRAAQRSGEAEQARVSATEPEARIMKTGQGGFAPCYNVQTLTAAEHKIVVNVELTQQAGDQGQLQPGLERLATAGAEQPQLLVDGGYVTADNIVQAAGQGVELIGPSTDRERERARRAAQSLQAAGIGAEFGAAAFRIVENGAALECPAGRRLARVSQAPSYDQYRACRSDCDGCQHRARCCPKSPARTVKMGKPDPRVEQFYQRMNQPENRAVFRQRGPVAEFPHAWWKEKFGLRKFRLRGLRKARMEMKWAALAYNIQQWIRLSWRPRWLAAAVAV